MAEKSITGQPNDRPWVKEVDVETGPPGADIFVHVARGRDKGDWLNLSRKFLRVPSVGEYIVLDHASPWFRVEVVVHCPFEAEFGAEIYCTEVDHVDVVGRAMDKIFPESRH